MTVAFDFSALPNLRWIMVRYLFFPALCLIATIDHTAIASAADDRPNILFIFADDQSYKTISCYDAHPDWVSTPNIDALAKSGVRFERSYLGAWCMPSRASLLTGRLQHAVMSMTMEGEYPGSRYDSTECPFVPAQFRAGGYQTAQIGKWHTGTDTGFCRDWDFQIAWNRPGHPENAGAYYEGQILTFNGVDKLTEGYSTDNYTAWAVDYIEGQHRDATKPWYLWLCYGAIHGPTTPAERHNGSLNGSSTKPPADIIGPREGKPAYLENTQAWALDEDGKPAMSKKGKKKDNYDGGAPGKKFEDWIQQVNECNRAVDEGVGRVLDALKKSGQLENTLVVYSADQGYALGEHGLNQKIAPYDAAISSPMIISRPGKIVAGRVCRHPINAPDLIDLFCRTAEVEIPWKTHGRDIRPLLDNPEIVDWNSPTIMTSTSRNYGAETDKIPTDESLTSSGGVPWYVLLRDGPYKYIRYFVEGETEELYDLESDPEELTNLANASEHSDRLKRLRNLAKDELRRTDAKFVDSLPETKSELQSKHLSQSKLPSTTLMSDSSLPSPVFPKDRDLQLTGEGAGVRALPKDDQADSLRAETRELGVLSNQRFIKTSTLQGAYSIEQTEQKLIIKQGEAVIAEYVFNDPETNKTYLWPIYGPQGALMARSFPMKNVAGEKQDHYHHRGIWFGHEDIGGYDTWAEIGTFTKEKKSSPQTDDRIAALGKQKLTKVAVNETGNDSARIVAELDYLKPSGEKILTEIRKLTFSHTDRFRLIDIDQALIASVGDVVVGDKKDAGLSIRVPHTMAVDSNQGGAIQNSESLRDRDAWGKRANWVDYSGPNPVDPMGIVMMNHPSSFRATTTWHVRTYGLFTANPFGTLDESSPNGPHTIKNGEKIFLKHRFVFYDGKIETAEIERVYQEYAASK
jgi:arylsulfatase A-like enzyme